jgi:hypothetical protein
VIHGHPPERYRPTMSLELVPLCTATVTLADTITVSPTFVIGEVTSARFEGERLRASMKGVAAADWLTVSPEGFGTLDVKVTLETDDGAVIHATYSGRLLFETMTVYATPTFHTGDERYRWLNRIQAVAKGHFPGPGQLVYEMYELR